MTNWRRRLGYGVDIALIIFFAVTLGTTFNWDLLQQHKYNREAKKHPGQYSPCIIRGEIRPHKKMYALGDGKYICHHHYGRADIEAQKIYDNQYSAERAKWVIQRAKEMK